MKAGAIFDMDGLMIDSESVYQKYWHQLAEENGIVLGEHFIRDIAGTSGEKRSEIIERYFHVEDGTELFREEKRRTLQEMEHYVPVKPGLIELLEYFKAHGIRMAVASSSAESIILHNLKQTDTEKYFDAIVSGEDIPFSKPEPDIFVKAANRLHIAPGDCYVFEDAINGIKAAHRAGACAIMIPDMLEPSEDILSYVHVYQKLDDVIPDIENGNLS